MGTKAFPPVNTLAEETVDGSCVSAEEELDAPFNSETFLGNWPDPRRFVRQQGADFSVAQAGLHGQTPAIAGYCQASLFAKGLSKKCQRQE